jgi:hypothetical protein
MCHIVNCVQNVTHEAHTLQCKILRMIDPREKNAWDYTPNILISCQWRNQIELSMDVELLTILANGI